MSQQNDSGFLSIVAGAARAAFLRVYNSSGTWTTAGAANSSVGVQTQPSLASTDIVGVKAITAPGTIKMTASELIVEGAAVYAAASGKVASTGTIIEGIALEAASANGDIIEVLPVHNRDVSSAITGTTAASFEVDSDAATPKIALQGQAAGTGDFTSTLKPETTLSADNAIIVPEADGDTLVAVALAQTLTNKTLTSPTITTMLIDDSDTGLTVTAADQTHAAPTATIPDIVDAADTFAMLGIAQSFTGVQMLAGNVGNTAGVGITGTAASFVTSVEKIGTIIKTTIVIDLTGLNSGGTANDIIGADGAGVAHLGQITAAVNGTIISGRLTCLETPATGDDDIDVYSATEATGVEDTLVTDLTETALCNSGDLTAGTVVALTPPAADQYLYLAGGTGDSDATYSTGILLLEFWGKAA